MILEQVRGSPHEFVQVGLAILRVPDPPTSSHVCLQLDYRCSDLRIPCHQHHDNSQGVGTTAMNLRVALFRGLISFEIRVGRLRAALVLWSY
jgi:hypothetical protein